MAPQCDDPIPAAAPTPASAAAPPTHDLRDIFHAILYVNRTGIAWRYLPHDFPPHATVYGYFAAWSKEDIFTELNYQLTVLGGIPRSQVRPCARGRRALAWDFGRPARLARSHTSCPAGSR